MLVGMLGGVAGAVSAQGMSVSAAMMTGPVAGTGVGATPVSWVAWLGRLSWPLLVVSILLLLVSFWRARPPARAVAYAGVALLVVNQFGMTPWLFLPALILVLTGFVLAATGRRAHAG